jgi:hypothetical protein
MRHQLRTYAQRLLHAFAESGQVQPAMALQPLFMITERCIRSLGLEAPRGAIPTPTLSAPSPKKEFP